MKQMDWKKYGPQFILGGGVVLLLGVGVVAKMRGECPFAMGARAIASAPAASDVSGAARHEAVALWQTDFKVAQEQARRENKVLLLSFSGSDWCPWCIRLDEEVLAQPEFLSWAGKHAVLIKLDFPRRAAQAAELRQQNEALAGAYGVEGFPTVVLADAAGREIARTGYRSGGAAAYVKHLEAFLPKGEGENENI